MVNVNKVVLNFIEEDEGGLESAAFLGWANQVHLAYE